MEHSFDILTAQKYGINAAVILRHLQFWIIKNKAHGKNFHDGRTWTYKICKVGGSVLGTRFSLLDASRPSLVARCS
ncbi:MAG: hypothetical protein FVQ85_17195 [Planctomycetes bacterium]|nr:hypothetical protein [Planctomycetota bacterium]